MRAARVLALTCAGLAVSVTARAADWELALLLGSAFPTYDERLSIRVPRLGSVPGIEVSGGDDFVLEADGGLVVGGTVAVEFGGFFAVEGRVDSARVDLLTTGTSYQFAVSAPGLPPFTASVAAGPGTIALDRLFIYSGNVRLRTPGPVSVYASGGFSYLSRLRADSALPLEVEGAAILVPELRGSLALVAEPSGSNSRVGFNGGAGLRVGLGGPVAVALFADARVFVFDSYDLQFEVQDTTGLALPDAAFRELPPIRFEPILVNVAGGVTVRF